MCATRTRKASRALADITTDFTGPADSKTAVMLWYDIFGFHPNTLQGADRLAAESGFLVIVPDFFEGNELTLDLFPTDTEEKKKKIEAFQPWREPTRYVDSVNQIVDELTATKGITTWGSFGNCFGGMVTVLTSAEGTKFKASGTSHPGRPVPDQARAVVIPYICLFSSKDGEPDVIEEYGNILKSKPGCVVDHYPEMPHGWMSARGNLKDEANIRDYKKGWSQAADFFKKTL